MNTYMGLSTENAYTLKMSQSFLPKKIFNGTTSFSHTLRKKKIFISMYNALSPMAIKKPVAHKR